MHVPDRTVFWAFAPYIVIWPVILLGLALEPLSAVLPKVFTDQVVALVWAGILVFVMNAMGQEFPRGHVVFLFMALTIGFVFVLYLGANHGESWRYFHLLWKWINSQDLKISHDLLRLISYGLLAGYAWMIGETFLSERYEATYHQLQRRRFMFGPEMLRLSLEYPAQVVVLDVFDWLLSFGGRWIICYDGDGKARRIGLVWGPPDLKERLDVYMESMPTREATH